MAKIDITNYSKELIKKLFFNAKDKSYRFSNLHFTTADLLYNWIQLKKLEYTNKGQKVRVTFDPEATRSYSREVVPTKQTLTSKVLKSVLVSNEQKTKNSKLEISKPETSKDLTVENQNTEDLDISNDTSYNIFQPLIDKYAENNPLLTKFIITDGEIANILYKNNGVQNLEQLAKLYAKNYPEKAAEIMKGDNLSDEIRIGRLFKLIDLGLNKYNLILKEALDGKFSDNFLTTAANVFGFENFVDNPDRDDFRKSVAKNIYDYIGDKNFNNQYSLAQIRGITEGKKNVEQNDDYLTRLYALENGEKKVLDFATDAAVTTLLGSGINKATSSIINLTEKLSPQTIAAFDKINQLTNTVGKRVAHNVSNPIAKKVVENIVLTPITLSTFSFTHPFTTVGTGLKFNLAYNPFYNKYLEQPINQLLGGSKFADFMSKEFIPASAMFFSMDRGLNRNSLQFLDNIVSIPNRRFYSNGLLKTYLNTWIPEYLTQYNAKVSNILLPARNTIMYGWPLIGLEHFNLNPGHFVENWTGSNWLGDMTDMAFMSTYGRPLNHIMAQAAYKLGSGSTNIQLLGNTLAKKKIPEDHWSTYLAERNPTLGAWYRMARSHFPTVVGATLIGRWPSNYGSQFMATPARLSRLITGQIVAQDNLTISGPGMTLDIGKSGSELYNGPGAVVKNIDYVVGHDPKLYNLDAIDITALKALGLGRFKKGLQIKVLMSGDYTRWHDGVKDGTIVPVKIKFGSDGMPVIDENGNYLWEELPLDNKNLYGREGAMPLSRVDNNRFAYFDTQGHLVDVWLDKTNGELLYRSMDNSGLGRASKSVEKGKASQMVKEGMSAFIDLNSTQTFNININGGATAIGDEGAFKNIIIPVPEKYQKLAQYSDPKKKIERIYYDKEGNAYTKPSDKERVRAEYARQLYELSQEYSLDLYNFLLKYANKKEFLKNIKKGVKIHYTDPSSFMHLATQMIPKNIYSKRSDWLKACKKLALLMYNLSTVGRTDVEPIPAASPMTMPTTNIYNLLINN